MASDSQDIPEPQPFVRQPERELEENGKRGAWLGCPLMGLVGIFALVLVGVALLLPPFSLGERLFGTPFVALSQGAPRATYEGLTVAVNPARPGSLSVRIGKYGAEGSAGAAREAFSVLPGRLSATSPVYQIEKRGSASDKVTLTFAVPQDAQSQIDQLDLYGYDAVEKSWRFVPAQPSPDRAALVATLPALPDVIGLFRLSRLAPVVSLVVEPGHTLTSQLANLANVIHPAGLRALPSGALQGALPGRIETGKGYAVLPVIRNFTTPDVLDISTVVALLQNPALRQEHIRRLAETAISQPFQGIAIDYRGIPAEQRANFSEFVVELVRRVRESNQTVTVVLPFPVQAGSGFETGGYDWQVIGAAADTIQVLLPLDPHLFAAGGAVESGLRWAVGEISRARLQIALSALDVEQRGAASDLFMPIAHSEALSLLGRVTLWPGTTVRPGEAVEAGLSGYRAQFSSPDPSGAASIKYYNPDGTLAVTVWLATSAAMRSRLERVSAYNLAGIAVLDLAAPGVFSEALDAISAYRVSQPQPAGGQPTGLTLRWTVQDQNQLVAEATGLPGTPFIYRPERPGAALKINAEVVGARSTLGPAPLQVATAAPGATPRSP